MNEIILASAFMMGLMGSGHCAGMCGGIASALSMGSDRNDHRLGMLPIVSAYNLGRLSSYVVAGALFGWMGSLGWSLLTPDSAIQTSRYIGIVFMAAFGLYLLGWWRGLAYLEQLGAKIWKYIEPVGRRFLPVRRPQQALILGMIWGWLPCGMVYTGLAWALASGEPQRGAGIMLAFGAGTLPMLMTLGIGGNWLAKWSQNRLIRQIAGILVLAMAGFLLAGGHGFSHSATTEKSPKIHLM